MANDDVPAKPNQSRPIPRVPDDEDEQDPLEIVLKKYNTDKFWVYAIQSIIRWALNILAAVLVARGVGTQKQWDEGVGAVVLVATLAWALYQQKKKNNKPCSVTTVTITKKDTSEPKPTTTNDTSDPQI